MNKFTFIEKLMKESKNDEKFLLINIGLFDEY